MEKHPSGAPGWFFTSAADSIITYDIENHKCYTYSLKEMRNYVQGKEFKRVGRNKDLICLPVENSKLIKLMF
jgi:hypothetical protein